MSRARRNSWPFAAALDRQSSRTVGDAAVDAIPSISCGALRSCEVIDLPEQAMCGKPVVTSNQGMLWKVPAPRRHRRKLDRLGRLFREF